MKEIWSNLCFYGRCIKIVCREWWRKVFTVAAVMSACGCVNLYTRCPWTNERIDRVYQCSREAAGLSLLVAFPQMMSDCPGDNGYMWENIFTVPLGCLCLCDAAVEACVDTVCLPVDWPLAASRKGGK